MSPLIRLGPIFRTGLTIQTMKVTAAINIVRQQSNSNTNEPTGQLQKASSGGFAKAMAKIEGHENFATLLRNCPMIQVRIRLEREDKR